MNTNNFKSNEYENKTDYLNDSFGEVKDNIRDDLARASSLKSNGEIEDQNNIFDELNKATSDDLIQNMLPNDMNENEDIKMIISQSREQINSPTLSANLSPVKTQSNSNNPSLHQSVSHDNDEELVDEFMNDDDGGFR